MNKNKVLNNFMVTGHDSKQQQREIQFSLIDSRHEAEKKRMKHSYWLTAKVKLVLLFIGSENRWLFCLQVRRQSGARHGRIRSSSARVSSGKLTSKRALSAETLTNWVKSAARRDRDAKIRKFTSSPLPPHLFSINIFKHSAISHLISLLNRI